MSLQRFSGSLTFAAACIALPLTLGACSKVEAPSEKPRANSSASAPKEAPDPGGLKSNVRESLQERLLRQQAAEKLFDKGKPEQVSPRQKTPLETARIPPAPVVAAPSKAPDAPKPPEPPLVAPVQAPVATTDTRATRPAPPPSSPIISRFEPEFPEEAVKAGIPRRKVKARVTLDADGNVMKVDIAEGTPRVLDRTVASALSQWVFEQGSYGRTVQVEVDFKRQ